MTDRTIDTTGWSAADIAALADAEAQLDNITKALASSEDIDKAARESPAAKIEAMKREAEAKRAELARIDRERIDTAALREAEQKHGADRIAVIETRSGNVIIRTATPREADEVSARVNADGLPTGDRERIARDALA